MKVLLAGGDGDIVRMTSRILRRNSYEVSEAVGEAEAFRKLEDEEHELLIIDCDMGMACCLSLMQSARRSPAAPALLLLSDERSDEVPLLRAGADDWMLKPYQMDVLLARMKTLERHCMKRRI